MAYLSMVWIILFLVDSKKSIFYLEYDSLDEIKMKKKKNNRRLLNKHRIFVSERINNFLN